ncbi:ArsC family reductase [Ramlibacter sp. PS4R-6]|uniref:ArsC family reductase n=1 Tax=Ramlibacter sp. PS4R-6 TaxID=3133438 RepID=UPI0030B707E6
MALTVYGIPNCDTVKKARAWLAERGVEHAFHDFKKQGVPPALLDRWISELGWEKLVNRNGTTWRKLSPQVQAGVTDATSAKRLMQENVSVIKRPVVEWNRKFTTVGFDAAQWQERLA